MTVFEKFPWRNLAGGSAAGDAIHVKRVVCVSGVEVVAGMDAKGWRHILIRLVEGQHEPAQQQTRGLSVRVRDLADPGAEHGRYIDIACQEPAGHAALDLIGNDIVGALSKDGSDPGEAVTRVVNRWRRFWGQIPQSLLSIQEQIGLFAELWFLFMWLGTRIPLADALSRWRGPLGARHDFESSTVSVEVKASSSTRGPIHRIHGVTQLEPPETGGLWLFSLQVRNEDGASNSLPAIVRYGQQLAASDADAAASLEDRLSKAGYSASHDGEYEKLRLRVVAEGLYHVADDFPRVVRTTFGRGVPGGVEQIEYDINLGAYSHLLVATRPTDFYPV
jgi:hypothetical protein